MGVGLLISAGYLGQLIGALVFGYFSEIYGRKTAFVYSMALFGLLSIIAAFAWNLQSLLVIRLVQGLGIGAEVPIAATIFNEYIRGRNRGKVGMIYETLYPWGYILAPLLALLAFGLFGPALGWRALFIFGGIPLIIAIVAHFTLPESVRWLADKHRVEEAESIISAMEAEAESKGVRLAELPAQTDYHADIQRTRFGELFSRPYLRRTIMMWVQWFTAFFVLTAYSGWLPTLYVKLGHLSASTALLLTTAFGLAEVIILYIVAFTWDRVGRKPWFIGGYILAVVGAAMGFVSVSLLHITTWSVLATAGLLMAIGVYISVAGVYVYTSELYPTRMRSWATATGRGFNSAASAIAPSAVGAILSTGLGIGGVFVMFFAVALVGLIVVAALGIETKQRVLEELAA